MYALNGSLYAGSGSLILPYLCETGEVEVLPSASAVPRPSPAPVYCLPGWSAFSDVQGREGQSSCLFVFGVPANHADATATCAASAAGAHLLTVNEGILGNFALTLLGERSGWVGATHDPAVQSRFAGWAWVDGTESAATIMNCGQVHCGAWGVGHPTYVSQRSCVLASACACFVRGGWVWTGLLC